MNSFIRNDFNSPRSVKSMSKHSAIVLAGFLSSVMLTVPTFAQMGAMSEQPTGSELNLRGQSTTKDVELGQGASATINLPRDAKEVFISEPTVADAIVRSSDKVFVIGKAMGRATVVVTDKSDREIMTLNVRVGRDLSALRKTLALSIPTANVDITVSGYSIILTGTVDSAADAAKAADIAQAFFDNTGNSAVNGVEKGHLINSLTIRAKEQVMLKVTVAEVQRAIVKQLGVSGGGSWQIGNINMEGILTNSIGAPSGA